MMSTLKERLFYILLLLPVVSCSDNKTEETLPRINIDMDAKTANDRLPEIFSKIEIVPLQTSDSSLVGEIENVICNDRYIIVKDTRNILTVFDDKGNYRSKSSGRLGNGPQDYMLMMGCCYNPFTDNIEVLTTSGIVSYDKDFNFVGRVALPTKSANGDIKSLFFDGILAYEKDKYILVPTPISEDPYRAVFFDADKAEIEKNVFYKDDVITALTGFAQNTGAYNANLLAFPPRAFSYFLYTIDVKDKSLSKKFRIDFGNRNITKNDLKNFQDDFKKSDYIAFESDIPSPLRTLFNEDYTVCLIGSKNEFFTYIKSEKIILNFSLKTVSAPKRNFPFFTV